MENIKKIIKQLFKSIGIKEIEIDIKKDNSLKHRELLMIYITVKPEYVEDLIKEGAVGLSSLQHLLRLMIFRKNLSDDFIILDINNYKEKREEYLNKLAQETADDVRKTKKPVTLDSMSAYERRIIHLKLAEQSDIVSESTGLEPERKVIVRPYP